MTPNAWNHNIHYHPLVLEAVPSNCRRALDVGCGQGLLARQLAASCLEVVAIDADHDTLASAMTAGNSLANITFAKGDVMTQALPGDFDLIAAVATLHHLPLHLALERFRDLLSPGGVLVVVGLYRARTLADAAWNVVALPASWMLRRFHNHEEPGTPMQTPRETLCQIRSVSQAVLPGAVVRRRLLFRYSLVWRKE